MTATVVDENQRAGALSALHGEEAGEQLRYSIAGRVGQIIEPIIEPLGFDWRIGVGILGAFAAREVFVSTLGIVFGIAEADEESPSLPSISVGFITSFFASQPIKASIKPSGTSLPF